jgi:GntR family transcriptional regulator, transcriptional repressor for pyruvate dehydrogenase complex
VLPSRRRFMKHFAAGEVDAAVTEMGTLLDRLNRYYLSLWKDKDRAEAANG